MQGRYRESVITIFKFPEYAIVYTRVNHSVDIITIRTRGILKRIKHSTRFHFSAYVILQG